MGNAARKARKRAGEPLVKPAKTPTVKYRSKRDAQKARLSRSRAEAAALAAAMNLVGDWESAKAFMSRTRKDLS